MRRESINALSELTGFDRRTIGKKLADTPFTKSGRSHLYDPQQALRVIYAADGGDYDLTIEKARLAHHQANLAALDEEVKKKNLIPAEVVLERWQTIAANVRARLLSMPSQLAANCANASRDEVQKKANELVRMALEELASVDY